MRWFVRVMTLIFMSFVFPLTMQVYGVVEQFDSLQSPIISNNYSSIILKNDTGAWYYQINNNAKTFILQQNIPAITGNKAFIDSTQAALVAHLVIDKLEKGFFPPSIQISELDSLKIFY